jgi:hypothetical protein
MSACASDSSEAHILAKLLIISTASARNELSTAGFSVRIVPLTTAVAAALKPRFERLTTSRILELQISVRHMLLWLPAPTQAANTSACNAFEL